MLYAKKKHCVSCFKALGDQTRSVIIAALKSDKHNVASVTQACGVTQPTVSHHLKILLDLGIISKEKKGRETLYALNKNYPCKSCGLFKGAQYYG